LDADKKILVCARLQTTSAKMVREQEDLKFMMLTDRMQPPLHHSVGALAADALT
jgi:hypothetical protein